MSFHKHPYSHYSNSAEGFLFTTRNHTNITCRSIHNVFVKRLRLAGLEHKSYTPHTLRHNFATDMFNSGANIFTIKELLGHSYMQSTSFYLHLTDFEEGLESPLDHLLMIKKGGDNHG